MHTTTRTAVDVVAHIEALKRQLLTPREHYLRGKAPRDPYVAMLRRDIARGQAKPLHMLLASLCADVEDGVPADLATQVLDSLKALVHEHAQKHARHRAVTNLLPYVQRAQRTHCAVEQAEARALVEPTDAVLAEVEEAVALDEDADEQVLAVVRERRARQTVGGAA